MPRIEIHRYTPQEFDYGEPFAAGVAAAGRQIGEAFSRASRDKLAARKLDIEEARAKEKLLREENRAAERDADRQAALDAYKGDVNQATGDTMTSGITAALQSPGGALGPFGFLNEKAFQDAAAKAKGYQDTMAGNVAIARNMSPAGARQFLTKETAKLKKQILADGYESELKDLQNALADGKFEDPFLVETKGGNYQPSPAALKKADDYKKALTYALKSGRQPGAVHDRLRKEYELNAKLSARKKAWDQADQQADQLLEQLRGVMANAPAGVDPVTGKDIRETMAGKLATGAAEWERTNATSFRRAHDAQESINGLQKILFGAEAQADPEAFLRQQTAEAKRRSLEGNVPLSQRPTPEQAVAAAGRAGAVPAAGFGGMPIGRNTLAPGRGKTDTGARLSDAEIAAQRPAREAERVARGLVGRTNKPGGKLRAPRSDSDRRALYGLAASKVAEIATPGGGSTKEKIRALQRTIEKDLGIDPLSPEAQEILAELFNQASAGARGGP